MKLKMECNKSVFYIRRLVDQVANGGERVIIQQDGKWAAALVSIEDLAYLEMIDKGVPVKIKR